MSAELRQAIQHGADIARGASVVLVREGYAGVDVLLRALDARGLPAEVVRDEPTAMLALSGLNRRGAGRRVLVVVEPACWARADELIEAVRAYHGGVHCWRFAPNGDGVMSLSQCPEGYGRHSNAGAGALGRVRRRIRSVDRLLVSTPGRSLTAREVVTQQELTMLLGPMPGEAG